MEGKTQPVVLDSLCLSSQREIYIEVTVIIQKLEVGSGRSPSRISKF